jgi:hypothetical protein
MKKNQIRLVDPDVFGVTAQDTKFMPHCEAATDTVKAPPNRDNLLPEEIENQIFYLFKFLRELFSICLPAATHNYCASKINMHI